MAMARAALLRPPGVYGPTVGSMEIRATMIMKPIPIPAAASAERLSTLPRNVSEV